MRQFKGWSIDIFINQEPMKHTLNIIAAQSNSIAYKTAKLEYEKTKQSLQHQEDWIEEENLFYGLFGYKPNDYQEVEKKVISNINDKASELTRICFSMMELAEKNEKALEQSQGRVLRSKPKVKKQKFYQVKEKSILKNEKIDNQNQLKRIDEIEKIESEKKVMRQRMLRDEITMIKKPITFEEFRHIAEQFYGNKDFRVSKSWTKYFLRKFKLQDHVKVSEQDFE